VLQFSDKKSDTGQTSRHWVRPVISEGTGNNPFPCLLGCLLAEVTFLDGGSNPTFKPQWLNGPYSSACLSHCYWLCGYTEITQII
jgi:hypothetical protein